MYRASPEQTASELPLASLLLGYLSLVFSIVVIGALLGIVGLILGIVDVARRVEPRRLAIRGTILSSIGILLSVTFGFLYLHAGPRKENTIEEAIKPSTDWTRFSGKVISMSRIRSTPGANPEKWVNTEAPNITTTNLSGSVTEMNALKGKKVMILIWATWSLPCCRIIPNFTRLSRDFSADDLLVIGMSNEDEEKLNSFVKAHDINFPVVSADTLPAPYNEVDTIPTTFVIDRNGVLQNVLVGYQEYAILKSEAEAPDFEGIPQNAPTPIPKEIR